MVRPPQDDSHLRQSSAERAAILRMQARAIEDEAWDAPSEADRARIGRQADKLRSEAERIEQADDYTVVLF